MYTRRIGLVLGPVIYLLILMAATPEGMTESAKSTLASTMWIAIWWVTECIPIAATALLPIVLLQNP